MRPSEALAKNIDAVRAIIAHGYFDVDFDIVWDTTQKSVPVMASVVRRILNDRAKGEKK
jgi:uncharacterized protein with HEPN domain